MIYQVVKMIPCPKGWDSDQCYDEGDLNGCGRYCNRDGTKVEFGPIVERGTQERSWYEVDK